MSTPQKYFKYEPTTLIQHLLSRDRRVLLFGQPGVGKTTLATTLASQLFTDRRSVWCLGADPGSPKFGIPGAICLGSWKKAGWSLQKSEALCSFDAARFRLPLVSAVRTLATEVTDGSLLLDAPGVISGVAGAELLTSLVQAADIDMVLVLLRQDQTPPMAHELQTLGIELAFISAADKATRPTKTRRAQNRTRLWDLYLDRTEVHRLFFRQLQTIGTPPRRAPEAWIGKQVAFFERNHTVSMGEVADADNQTLWIRLP
ncbi:MAG: hypothetical protein GY934_00495, partial [Gammaproteobacteria bacterium]|nr:hypothetical protein [Gammaproteobacteria bacterium]